MIETLKSEEDYTAALKSLRVYMKDGLGPAYIDNYEGGRCLIVDVCSGNEDNPMLLEIPVDIDGIRVVCIGEEERLVQAMNRCYATSDMLGRHW